MSAIFPVVYLFAVGALWLTAVILSSRLFRRFRDKYPIEASKKIPYAFAPYSHPEKFFFFFRKQSLEMLKQDPALWHLRQQVKLFTIVSLVFLIVGFLVIAGTAILDWRR